MKAEINSKGLLLIQRYPENDFQYQECPFKDINCGEQCLHFGEIKTNTKIIEKEKMIGNQPQYLITEKYYYTIDICMNKTLEFEEITIHPKINWKPWMVSVIATNISIYDSTIILILKI